MVTMILLILSLALQVGARAVPPIFTEENNPYGHFVPPPDPDHSASNDDTWPKIFDPASDFPDTTMFPPSLFHPAPVKRNPHIPIWYSIGPVTFPSTATTLVTTAFSTETSIARRRLINGDLAYLHTDDFHSYAVNPATEPTASPIPASNLEAAGKRSHAPVFVSGVPTKRHIDPDILPSTETTYDVSARENVTDGRGSVKVYARFSAGWHRGYKIRDYLLYGRSDKKHKSHGPKSHGPKMRIAILEDQPDPDWNRVILSRYLCRIIQELFSLFSQCHLVPAPQAPGPGVRNTTWSCPKNISLGAHSVFLSVLSEVDVLGPLNSTDFSFASNSTEQQPVGKHDDGEDSSRVIPLMDLICDTTSANGTATMCIVKDLDLEGLLRVIFSNASTSAIATTPPVCPFDGNILRSLAY